MEKQNLKAFLYLLPALIFLGLFLVYPLIDVFVYSFEEDTARPLRAFSAWGTTTTAMSCTIRTSPGR